jgi:Flp pilus assembly pilin Flp
MEYLTIAYVLIAAVLVGYAVNLRTRLRATESERARFESKNK